MGCGEKRAIEGNGRFPLKLVSRGKGSKRSVTKPITVHLQKAHVSNYVYFKNDVFGTGILSKLADMSEMLGVW